MRARLASRLASRVASRRAASTPAAVVGRIGELDARNLELKEFALPARPPAGLRYTH